MSDCHDKEDFSLHLRFALERYKRGDETTGDDAVLWAAQRIAALEAELKLQKGLADGFSAAMMALEAEREGTVLVNKEAWDKAVKFANNTGDYTSLWTELWNDLLKTAEGE